MKTNPLPNDLARLVAIATAGSPLQVAAHLLAFGTAVVSWKYVKEANRIAAMALQYEFDKVLKAN